jgi:signal peptidase I
VLVAESRDIPTELGVTKPQVWREHLGGISYEVARLAARNYMRSFDEVVVPAGHVMVMGDSRDNSNDSRFIGFIDVQRITGRAHHVAFSHDVGDYYIPRANRWWLPLHQTD